jgi:putative oxidoreductase
MRISDKLIYTTSQTIRLLDFLSPLIDLGARLWLANVFWKSGITKIASWSSTTLLFTYEYHVPVLSPEVAAFLATAVELGGSALLAVGLFSRFGAAALFVLNITAVIAYPDLSESGLRDHYFWGILLLIFLFHGPGKISIDHFIRKRWMKNPATPDV